MNVRCEKGLTLIEVLIVVALLVALLSLLIPNIVTSSQKAEEKMCYSTQIMVEAQIELYRLDQKGTFPSMDDASSIITALKNGHYIKEDAQCPSGGTYRWNADTKRLICSIHDHHSGEETFNNDGSESGS